MRRWLAALALAVSACDPGGTYHVTGGTEVQANGRQYDLAGPSNTALRTSASWFTSSLSVYLTVTNKGSSPLTVRASELHATDRVGPLDRKRDAPPHCAHHEHEDLVTLTPGESCDLFEDFSVQVKRDRLRTVTVAYDGLARDGVAVPISVTFEMDR